MRMTVGLESVRGEAAASVATAAAAEPEVEFSLEDRSMVVRGYQSCRRRLASAARTRFLATVGGLIAALTATGATLGDDDAPRRTVSPMDPLASTYSIVARHETTGELGVAVQSHWFQVGTSVAWAEAGVGAVATQSFIDPAYGPRGLALLKQGVPAPRALEWLTGEDANRSVRQVAIIDRQGRVAAWTGEDCIQAAGHQTGSGYSVQANLMAEDTVPKAMAAAYEQAAREGKDLAERLMLALEAAEGEGGDIRGRQSAALLVVAAEASRAPWRDRLVDLRVDDHPEPLRELRRLLVRHRAYELMNQGDEAVTAEDYARAGELYGRAQALAPDLVEIPFWKAVTLFAAGSEAEALPIFAQVFSGPEAERWKRLLPRLPAAGLLPDDPVKIERILATGKEE